MIGDLFRVVALAVIVVPLAGCGAVRGVALKSVASTLSETGGAIASHDDPDTIEGAIPFTLTLYESLLESLPKHEPLLTAACATYTQYAVGFIAPRGEAMQWDDFEQSQELNARALRLAARGRDLCWRALEIRFPGIGQDLKERRLSALRRARREHVPLLYWSAASLGAAIASGGVARPDLLNDWPTVRALGERGLALDDRWSHGALHELMLVVESQGELLAGSEERARGHFARAVEMQRGLSPGPHVALAMGLVKNKQDRVEFERLMRQALAIDPDKNPTQRLSILLTQRRARVLLAHVDDMFLAGEALPE